MKSTRGLKSQERLAKGKGSETKTNHLTSDLSSWVKVEQGLRALSSSARFFRSFRTRMASTVIIQATRILSSKRFTRSSNGLSGMVPTFIRPRTSATYLLVKLKRVYQEAQPLAQSKFILLEASAWSEGRSGGWCIETTRRSMIIIWGDNGCQVVLNYLIYHIYRGHQLGPKTAGTPNQ